MDFEIPEDITLLDDNALATALSGALAAQAAFADISDEEITDEQIDQFEAINGFVTAAQSAQEERGAAATARQERLSAARGAVAPAASAAPAEPAEPAAPAEPAEPAVVAAGAPAARPSALSALNGRQAEPTAARSATATIVASAGAPNLNLGQEIDIAALTQAAVDQFSRMGTGRGVGHQEYPLAQIRIDRTDGLHIDEFATADEMLTAAADETRLRNGSLVAAGGWCAPSETLYDLFAEETTEGLWDLPSTNWGRGGINFTRGPQFADFYAQTDGHWWYTEAEVEAGTDKPFIDIDCPDFTEVRLDAVGVGIKVPFLTNAAYPEYVQRFISGTLAAQQHRVSATLLQKALTIAGTATAFGNIWPTATSVLTVLELVVESERQRYRLSPTATLEGVAPMWLRAALRADLSQRTGVNMLNVTDADLDAHFRSRGVNLQFVYNWQPLTLTGTNGVGPATDFPSNVEILLYPAGTFVKGTKDIVDLRTVYDLPTLKENKFTGLFAEEGVGLAWRRFKPQRISFALNVTGRTAAADISQDWATAPVTP